MICIMIRVYWSLPNWPSRDTLVVRAQLQLVEDHVERAYLFADVMGYFLISPAILPSTTRKI